VHVQEVSVVECCMLVVYDVLVVVYEMLAVRPTLDLIVLIQVVMKQYKI
jgi:hypothetical protein